MINLFQVACYGSTNKGLQIFCEIAILISMRVFFFGGVYAGDKTNPKVVLSNLYHTLFS